ncbi:kinase-like domain-containing protein [Mycena polygramma]|nr:kinase-like domain-containing protein [Mycena polygramma]
MTDGHNDQYPIPPEAEGLLKEGEVFWRDLQPWLQQLGFTLRPRFRREWVPSWLNVPGRLSKVPEDQWQLIRVQVIDAVRDSDGLQVVLKKVEKQFHPFEEEIHQSLTSPELLKDPKNHCVPLLDVLRPPDKPGYVILVIKLLKQYDNPDFDTVGEVLDFLQQIFEGVQFMHKRDVAHRDCAANNIMMDGQHLYPEGFHPQYQFLNSDLSARARQRFTRTERPPKYYLIDFGISVQFKPGHHAPFARPIIGADSSDVFRTDIYYLGNLMFREFLEGRKLPDVFEMNAGRVGFEFLRPLATDMVNPDPQNRPDIDEVLLRFEKIKGGLSTWKLRSRARSKREVPVFHPLRIVAHWRRRIGFIIHGIPPIPVYRG